MNIDQNHVGRCLECESSRIEGGYLRCFRNGLIGFLHIFDGCWDYVSGMKWCESCSYFKKYEFVKLFHLYRFPEIEEMKGYWRVTKISWDDGAKTPYEEGTCTLRLDLVDPQNKKMKKVATMSVEEIEKHGWHINEQYLTGKQKEKNRRL